MIDDILKSVDSAMGKAPSAGLFYFGTDGKEHEIMIDVFTKLSPSHKSTITKSYIEDGSYIADHVTVEPFSITFDAVISNTPIVLRDVLMSNVLSGVVSETSKRAGAVAGAAAGIGIASYSAYANKSENRADTVYDTITDLWKRRQIVTLQTGLKAYPMLVITGFQPEITGETGSALRFTMSLEEIRTAYYKAEQVTVKAKAKLGKKKDLGAQQIKPATEQTRATILKKGINAGLNFINGK